MAMVLNGEDHGVWVLTEAVVFHYIDDVCEQDFTGESVAVSYYRLLVFTVLFYILQ